MESTMQSMILQTIRAHFIRACLVVGERRGQQMDTSIREQIWEEMTGNQLEVRPPSPVIRQEVEVPLLAAAPAAEVDYGDRMPGGMGNGPFSTPKRPTKPVLPTAPERPVKPAEEESVAGSEEKEDTKLTPQQRLEKQKVTTTEKLDKLRARQGTAKQTAKQKEADPKEIAKLEEKLKDINSKLEKLTAKAAKPNFEKWTPTWTKHFKTAADAAKIQVNDDTKSDFVHYLNTFSAEEFKKPSYLEHATRYFQQRAAAGVGLVPDVAAKPAPPPEPEEDEEEYDEDDGYGAPERPNWVDGPEEAPAKPAVADADDDEDMVEVSYDGETYVVGERSKQVFRATDAGDVPVTDLATIAAVIKKSGL